MATSTKQLIKGVTLLILFLAVFSSIQTVAAYHGRNVVYNDPYYYGYNNGYYNYPYYTHHQYHYLSYNNHYAQYNRYYYYPPPRYYRYSSYRRCSPNVDFCPYQQY